MRVRERIYGGREREVEREGGFGERGFKEEERGMAVERRWEFSREGKKGKEKEKKKKRI